jgi:hypothetical protein
MAHLKMLCLVALTTAALFASVGAGSASADSFCRDAVNPCHEGYAPPTTFTAATKSAVLKGTSFEVTCASTLVGESTSYLEKGKGVTGKITALTFSGCAGACATSSASSLPYSMLALATTGGNGTATVSSGGGGSPSLTLTGCTATKQTCTYTTSEIPMGFEGGNGGEEASNPKLALSSITLTKTSGPCPATAALTAKYIANKVGIQTNASWYWWSDDPIVTWYDYDFGEVKAGTTATVTFFLESSVELQYGTLILVGNKESVFGLGVDNCSGQKIFPKCSFEAKATPKAAGPTYEATIEVPWEETNGSQVGTLNIRLRVKGK